MSRRAPTRRAPVPRRRRSRKLRGTDQGLIALAVAAGAVFLVATAVQWLLAHWWVLLVAALSALGALAWRWREARQRRERDLARARALRLRLPQIDGLHHTQFETAVRDLLIRDGCTDAARTGGRGDLGADVIGTDPTGRRWVVQCKHRKRGASGSSVGTPDLQRLNGTARPVHKADVVVLVTNGKFSRDARPFAKSQHIHLVDRDVLALWAGGQWPLWDLLDRIPAPRRPTPLS